MKEFDEQVRFSFQDDSYVERISAVEVPSTSCFIIFIDLSNLDSAHKFEMSPFLDQSVTLVYTSTFTGVVFVETLYLGQAYLCSSGDAPSLPVLSP